MKTYYALGLMSGSSLDGLDIAYCRIDWQNNAVADWEIIEAATLPFTKQWQRRLSHLPAQNALVFAKTHTYFGHYIATLVQEFVAEYKPTKIDFIASHGHTIFHEPDKRLSVQIGDGAAIAAQTGYQTITDFRTQDVALNGEGAPLAPLADKYLFEGFDFYLNIGGIANLSAHLNGQWLALDTSPANQILNTLAEQKGAAYDDRGQWASQGKVLPALLQQAAQLDYYPKPAPKSIGNGWVQQEVLPIYLAAEGSTEDKLATACEHTAIEIAKSIAALLQQYPTPKKQYKMLLSGGGVFNDYLIETIDEYCNEVADINLQIPSPQIIGFKEAALMALLGVLRLEEQPNSWRSTTGADRDTVNGAVYAGYKS